MSKGYNKVMLLGGLTKDPDVRYSQDRTAYLWFNLACGYSKPDGHGGWTDEVDYVSCTAFNNTAETIGKYCVKGSQLFVEGKLRTIKRKNKAGEDIYELQMLVQNIRFAGGKRKDEGSNGGYSAPAASEPAPAPARHNHLGDMPGVEFNETADIPF